jgi:shikimate kinase
MSPVVVIVGAPGAGKTTVGKLLAKNLGVEFRDTDIDIEKTAGKSVSDIFVDSGESTFRQLETEALKTALADHSGVLALGGGAVLAQENRDLLHGHNVVWLQVDLTNAATRVGLNTSRPLLLGNVRNTLKKLMDDREVFYAEVATHQIATSEKNPQAVVDEILKVMS